MSFLRVGLRGALAAVAIGVFTGCSTSAEVDGPATSTEQVGARAALSGFACTADDAGAWSASGTLSNAEEKTVTFVVRVSVAGTDSAVKAKASDEVAVEPGRDVAIRLPAFGTAQGADLACSAHVTRLLA